MVASGSRGSRQPGIFFRLLTKLTFLISLTISCLMTLSEDNKNSKNVEVIL